MSQRLRSIGAALGALVYALAGIWILWSFVATLPPLMPEFAASGSAGLGAVSIGISQLALDGGLLAIASLVVNRMLARWARQSGGRARVLHRTHGWSIVVPFVLFITGIVAVNMKPGPVTFLLVPLSGATWGLQFVLTSVLLEAYALRTPRT